MTLRDGDAAGRRGRPNLFTIPASLSFLDTLADAVLSDALGLGVGVDDPARLAGLTIYLPTRRAVRALAQTMLARSGKAALLLPRLVPLGDPGEAEMEDVLASGAAEVAEAGEALPIAPLTRQVLLALQIRQASRARDASLAKDGGGGSLAASTLGSAFALARDLAAILDAMQAEDVPYERLTGLDATRFDELWQLTARFLAILGESWPAILSERGEVDPITWRNALLARQADRIARGVGRGPVIVAGSTGSMPATARLMAAVARSPRGAVVLPDLDLDRDADDVEALQRAMASAPDRFASQPEAQLIRLLGTMAAARADVRPLGGLPERARAARRRLAHEALRPAETTERWLELEARLGPELLEHGLDGVCLIEAPDERLEALAIAVAIRRALRDEDATVALVTPDRGLAERVSLELERWSITVDDSAGLPLSRMPAGHFVLLLVEAMQRPGDALTWLELARHPAARFGLAPETVARGVSALEIGVLRGAREFLSAQELIAALGTLEDRIDDHRAPAPRRRLGRDDVAAAHALVEAMRLALAEVFRQAGQPSLPFPRVIGALTHALEAASRDEDGRSLLFGGEDGVALARLLDDLGQALEGVEGSLDDLSRILRDAMAGVAVRPTGRAHPRVMLLGLIEARLMEADLVILGGLNEGSWPPATSTDPFLNRAMRAELRLSSPERRIGQSAHDFIDAFSARKVILSRAAKAAGVQALASRFWQRLKAVAPDAIWRAASAGGEELVALAASLDQPKEIRARARPQPRPPAALQPRRYSVTEVATLYRDPYAVFAQRILGLEPLEPLQAELGAADRGSLLHEVVERFGRDHPSALPPDPEAVLLAIGEAVFAPLMGELDVAGFWWPRFVALVPAIADWERARRPQLARLGVEMRVASALRLPNGGEVTLSARADRIEHLGDGSLAIVDFKSGAVPSHRQINAGLAPQLTLEAALARLSPFVAADTATPVPSLGPAPVTQAIYVGLKLEGKALKVTDPFHKLDLAALADEHLLAFTRMVAGFLDGSRPFTSRFAPQFMNYASAFDHLARFKEWSAGEGASVDEAGP